MSLPRLRAAASSMAAVLRRRALPVLLLACGGVVGAGAAGAADDAVLLASTTPGYAPGMVVAAGERLVLPEGASVTLLFRSGQMLRLRGPADVPLDLAAPDPRRDGVVATLAEALRLRGVDASVIGGTRMVGLGRPARPPARDVWVDVQRSGTYCISPADTVWLSRLAAGPDAASLALRRRGNQRVLAWPSGVARIEWPSDVAIEDGDRFEVSADGRSLATLTFRTIAGTAPSEAASVAEGMLLGCHEQHGEALRRLARAALPPELWLTTERGRAPVYHPGEPIGLVAVSATEGWLYCVSLRGDGAAMPVFPAGAPEAARLTGAAAPLAIPGPRQGAGLRAGAPGAERIRCWLADRDISPELPAALLGPAGTRLPDRVAADLDAVFAGIGGGRMTAASLEIRVE